MYKIKDYGLLGYLFKSILLDTPSYNTRFSENITTYHYRTDTLKNAFFPWTIVEWEKLDLQFLKATYKVFRNHMLKSIQPLSKPIYNIHNPLRLGLSHLNKHRFNHSFERCIKTLCACTLEVESTTHFFLHCHYYKNIRKTVYHDLKVININISKVSETALTDLLLYGEANFDKIQNKMTSTASMKFIVDSDWFTDSILFV